MEKKANFFFLFILKFASNKVLLFFFYIYLVYYTTVYILLNCILYIALELSEISHFEFQNYARVIWSVQPHL